MKTYHVVEFHADGGQMCIPGRRCFTNPMEANRFARRMRSEPDHTCGPKSVKQYTSRKRLCDKGAIYPEIANS